MAAGKIKKKKKVWLEYPVGSKKGKARCACHYTYPCARSAGGK